MISQTQIDSIVHKIATNYQPEKIILFGSYANGNPNDDSDLDFCVIKETSQKIHARSLEIRKILRPLSVPVDIFVFTPAEFDTKKNWVNHIAYIANKYGDIKYENIHQTMD